MRLARQCVLGAGSEPSRPRRSGGSANFAHSIRASASDERRSAVSLLHWASRRTHDGNGRSARVGRCCRSRPVRGRESKGAVAIGNYPVAFICIVPRTGALPVSQAHRHDVSSGAFISNGDHMADAGGLGGHDESRERAGCSHFHLDVGRRLDLHQAGADHEA